MKYDENSTPEVLTDPPHMHSHAHNHETAAPEHTNPDQDAPLSKIIQIVLDSQTDMPTVNYTSDLTITQVLGALDIARQNIIAIHITDAHNKKRLLKAYQDV